MAPPGGSLSGAEQVLYKAISDADLVYQNEVSAACKGYTPQGLQEALNSLVRKNLVKILKDKENKVCFKAVNKHEAKVMGALDADEGMVYSHIQSAGNQGVWTRTLKNKTNLHQTVINRCLKALEQKQLVKSIPDVRYPTRKMYMLFNLTPAAEVTGGPWFTDNELDTEFIGMLTQAVVRFIRSKTWLSGGNQVWPVTATSKYPNIGDILQYLRRSGITETELEEEHVQALLDVLIYDGEIESLPGLSSSMWDDEEDADSEEEPRKKSKRKRHDSDEEDEEDDRRKKKRKHHTESDEEDDGKRKSDGEDDDSEGSDKDQKRRRKRARSESETDGSEGPSTSKRKKHKRQRRSPSLNESDRHISKPSRRSSNAMTFSEVTMDQFIGGGAVYRAIKREKITLGVSQAPCGRCEVFSFCKEGGPVNPRGCEYYDEWLGARLAGEDEEVGDIEDMGT